MDEAIKTGRLAADHRGPSGTAHLKLVGATDWDRAMHARIAQSYKVPHRPGAIDSKVSSRTPSLSNSGLVLWESRRTLSELSFC